MDRAIGGGGTAPSARGPSIGQFVSLRGRLWLVEGQPGGAFDGHRLACVDDDASGEDAQVLWGAEVTATSGTQLAAERAHAAAMLAVAEPARAVPDARVRWILDWARAHLLGADGRWLDRRLILFTEYEDTRRWLQRQLSVLVDPDDAHADARIDSFTGITSTERRETIKRAFNDPAHPLRILICTDAAREGINLQSQCHDLIHVDLPWNPSRLEQRNGRIDRKLQPSPTVTCRYFVYAERPEDVVLDALVRKTEMIRRQLGSAGQVLGARIADRLAGGIDRTAARDLADRIRDEEADERVRAAVRDLDDGADARLARLKREHDMVELAVRRDLRIAADLRRLIRSEAEIASYAAQAARHAEAEAALHRAKLVADAVLEAFFSGRTSRERDAALAEVQRIIFVHDPADWEPLLTPLRDRLHAAPVGITSFHWELEFEDVFTRANPGFDAIVGNPPFAGKNTIAAGHAPAYPDWLKALHSHAHGNADLAAHFFRRAYGLLRRGGAFGLIATNTIRQGDTRDTGLRRILEDGGTIYRAISRHQWEGDAAVVVAQVFVRKGAPEEAPAILDGRPVRRISAYLMEGDLDGSPAVLRENAGKSFAGTEIFGNGFTFDDLDTKQQAYPLTLMHDLRNKVPDFDTIVLPYLGGEEATNNPEHLARRFVIDFKDYPLQRTATDTTWQDADAAMQRQYVSAGNVPLDYPGAVASDWPILLQMVRDRVKPVREPDNREIYRRIWWRFAERRVDLYNSIRSLGHVLVVNRGATPHVAFARVPTGQVFSKTLAVFAFSSHATFATLQSRVHEVWTRFFASTLEDRLRYTPSDCFETFPLPAGHADAPALEAAGRAYHDHRAALMVARDQGMTPTYNRFHRAADTDADIDGLRRLHHDMDRAVLAAYGWDDLAADAAPVFLDAAGEDDHRYRDRLFWPAPFRDAVLARLLRLNEERAMRETML